MSRPDSHFRNAGKKLYRIYFLSEIRKSLSGVNREASRRDDLGADVRRFVHGKIQMFPDFWKVLKDGKCPYSLG